MLFSCPEVVENIKDIKRIYDINASQESKLNKDINGVESNLFIDTADVRHVERWEKMLRLSVYDRDTLNDRRFRVKSKIIERLPYTYRILENKLNALCDPSGYTLEVDTDAQSVVIYVNLSNKGSAADFEKILDDIIPMNMTIHVEILYNNHKQVAGFTHKELSKLTHKDIREEILRHEF